MTFRSNENKLAPEENLSLGKASLAVPGIKKDSKTQEPSSPGEATLGEETSNEGLELEDFLATRLIKYSQAAGLTQRVALPLVLKVLDEKPANLHEAFSSYFALLKEMDIDPTEQVFKTLPRPWPPISRRSIVPEKY